MNTTTTTTSCPSWCQGQTDPAFHESTDEDCHFAEDIVVEQHLGSPITVGLTQVDGRILIDLEGTEIELETLDRVLAAVRTRVILAEEGQQ